MNASPKPSLVDAEDESAADPGFNQRAGMRHRALLAGKIVFDQGARSLDCTIRNLSEEGAQVRVAGLELLPEVFYLLEARRALAHEARVAWIRPPHIGLKFLCTHRLDDPRTPELKLLRELYVERLAR